MILPLRSLRVFPFAFFALTSLCVLCVNLPLDETHTLKQSLGLVQLERNLDAPLLLIAAGAAVEFRLACCVLRHFEQSTVRGI